MWLLGTVQNPINYKISNCSASLKLIVQSFAFSSFRNVSLVAIFLYASECAYGHYSFKKFRLGGAPGLLLKGATPSRTRRVAGTPT